MSYDYKNMPPDRKQVHLEAYSEALHSLAKSVTHKLAEQELRIFRLEKALKIRVLYTKGQEE